MSACRRDGDDLLLNLHVQPNARRNELAGRQGDALKVRVAAPAVEGRANHALLAFLAELFDVPRQRLRLEHGAGARHKRVRVIAPRRLPTEIEPE